MVPVEGKKRPRRCSASSVRYGAQCQNQPHFGYHVSSWLHIQAFPNISFRAYKFPLIAEGDYVVGRWIGGGKHTGVAFDDLAVGKLDRPNTNMEIYFSGTTIFTLKDGKIVDEVGEEQALTALQQLELLLPPNPGREVKYDGEGNHI